MNDTDNRTEIELELTDEEFLRLSKMAHERDITFNQLIEIILQEEINRINDQNKR